MIGAFGFGAYIFLIYAQNRSERPVRHGARTCQIWQVLGDEFKGCGVDADQYIAPGMSKQKFTTEAALLWGGIPVEVQKRILKKAFCAKCDVFVEIVNYYGTVENGDLVLEGDCANCGHAAARVVETSKASHENN